VHTPRPLELNERALVEGLLAQDFDGVGALRQQALDVSAEPGCTCGCGSLNLFPTPSSPASTSGSPVPAEGVIRSDTGDEVGGLLLFLDAGRLSYLEVYSYENPLPLPHADRVEWVLSDRRK
jgi:hypothetical protein